MLKVFDVVFDDSLDNVFGISLVNSPAIEQNWITLSKAEKIKLATINEERRELLGVALIPDKLIYRVDSSGDEYNIRFSKENIKLFAHNFIKNGNQFSSIEHNNQALKDVFFAESWIIEDEEKDKTRLHGLDAPVGSWVVLMKINNEELWQNYIKNGELRGFSIDAIVNYQQINIKKESMTILEKLKKLAKKQVQMSEHRLKNENIILNFEPDLEVGASVTVSTEEEQLAVPAGSYVLEDDRTVVVDENGKVVEIIEVGKDEDEAEETTETTETNDQMVEMAQMKKDMEDLRKAVEESLKLSKSIKTLTEQVSQLSQKPAHKPLTSVKAVELNANGRFLEAMRATKAKK